MATPLFFHGLDALADKIRLHQIEHLAGPFNATSSVNLASRRMNSSFQSTIGRQCKETAVDPHAPRPHSTLSMPYKRLLPAQLSRLSPGDEIIVVVPSPNAHNSDVVESATVAFNKVLLHGCPRMNANQQKEHLSHVMERTDVSCYRLRANTNK
jgi:hypothetical protein